MNCKPGDIARIVKPGHLQGRIIVVTEIDPVSSPDRPLWLYAPPELPAPDGTTYISIFDETLRPIRDDDPPEAEPLQVDRPEEVTA
jgi:hypothetical protein